jgi:hypothetical protein
VLLLGNAQGVGVPKVSTHLRWSQGALTLGTYFY